MTLDRYAGPQPVLVTGAAGRVGGGVIDQLAGAGAEVVGFDRIQGPRTDVPWVVGDLLDRAAFDSAADGAGAVVHLAAIPRPIGSDPGSIIQTNVLGTHLLYEAVAARGVDTVVLLSSTAVIGTDWARDVVAPEYLPLDESHPCLPLDPYGMSKVICEDLADYAQRRWGTTTVILRAPWVTAPRDLEELAAAGGREPDGVHHYGYVTIQDLARAVHLALEKASELSGVTRMFVAAADSTLGIPLAEASPAMAEIRGVDHLGPFTSGVSSDRARSLLGWVAKDSWRESLTS